MNREIDGDLVSYVADQFFFAGIPLAFAFLYLTLFLFHPKERNYLYFGLLSAAVAAMTFVDLGGERLVYSEQYYLYRRLLTIIGIVMVVMLLRFVYALFYPQLPKRFWLILVGAVGFSAWSWLEPFDAFAAQNLAGLVLILEVSRTVAVAIWSRKPDAWLIGLGLILFMAGACYDIALDLGWMSPIGEVTNGYYYGFVGLLAPMALYLARDVARGHALEAEHARQRQELEAARALQLSMLPRSLPEHPSVELAAFMRTATEVGGDYYDFHVAEDGTLTIAIGDATGHGLRAGTMVTATKSLFTFIAHGADLEDGMARSSEALREMGMPQLYMALAVARLNNGTLEVVGAGMPPALLYRASTGQVESISLKGLPLGSPGHYPYRKTRFALSVGDTVAFMSDGFPELRNRSKELLGYDGAASVFDEVADRAPQEIIDHLAETLSAVSNSRPLNDDVTFVVLRMTGPVSVSSMSR